MSTGDFPPSSIEHFFETVRPRYVNATGTGGASNGGVVFHVPAKEQDYINLLEQTIAELTEQNNQEIANFRDNALNITNLMLNDRLSVLQHSKDELFVRFEEIERRNAFIEPAVREYTTLNAVMSNAVMSLGTLSYKNMDFTIPLWFTAKMDADYLFFRKVILHNGLMFFIYSSDNLLPATEAFIYSVPEIFDIAQMDEYEKKYIEENTSRITGGEMQDFMRHRHQERTIAQLILTEHKKVLRGMMFDVQMAEG